VIDPRELAEAIIGSLLVAIGLAAIAAGLSARPRRDRAALWFGVFSVLYGVRLCAKSALIQAVTPWPPSLFRYVEAIVTYAITIPAGLFVETLVGPGWYRSIRRAWQITCVYALAAALNDILRGQPFASMWLNAPVVLLTLMLQTAHLAARLGAVRWTIEIRTVAVAGALFAGVASYETLSSHGLFGRVDAEPFTMLFVSDEPPTVPRTCFYFVFSPAKMKGGKKCRDSAIFGCLAGRDCRTRTDQQICEMKPGIWD
jgi:hypothetical protein